MRATSRTIVRGFTKEGYHKDLAVLDSEQVRSYYDGMDKSPHLVAPFVPKVIVRPADFPEMIEFEVIVEEYK